MEFKGSIEGLISLTSLTVKLLEGLAPICHSYQQNCTAVTKRLKQLCVQRSTSAVNVTLLAFRCWPPCCWGPAAVDQYLLHAGRPAANPPHAASLQRSTDGTDRRTDTRSIHRCSASHTLRAMSVCRQRLQN